MTRGTGAGCFKNSSPGSGARKLGPDLCLRRAIRGAHARGAGKLLELASSHHAPRRRGNPALTATARYATRTRRKGRRAEPLKHGAGRV